MEPEGWFNISSQMYVKYISWNGCECPEILLERQCQLCGREVLSTLIKANGLSSFLFADIRIIFPLKMYARDQYVK